KTFKLKRNDVHECVLDNIYMHKYDNLIKIKNNNLNIYDDKYKMDPIICLTHRDIMPLIIYTKSYHSSISINVDPNITQFNVLTAIVNKDKCRPLLQKL